MAATGVRCRFWPPPLETCAMLSILVDSSKGGCGKTTIATHLAAYFA